MRRHKYSARRTTVDGITFASAKEARRYGELKLLERAGQISALKLQPSFELHTPRGGVVGRYIADFQYFDRRAGRHVIEDVKGMRTALYRWKKKHVESEYGITITEV